MSSLSVLAARWGWVPVFQRNLLVWRKLFVPSLIGNIAEPLFVLVAFGFGVGGLIGAVDYNGQAIPYLLFLASGSICASTMTAASFEGLYSAYSRMGPTAPPGRAFSTPQLACATLCWPRPSGGI